MSIFRTRETLFSIVKILILGSYLNQNLIILNDLKKYLRERGFHKTYLAKDLIKGSLISSLSSRAKSRSIYNQIKELMLRFDFNIFILFSNRNRKNERILEIYNRENESTIIELSSLVNSEIFEEKTKRTLVFLPKGYNPTMVEGFISQKKLNIFEYENEYEIFQKTFVFIKQNIR
jgi:hypothetical protein